MRLTGRAQTAFQRLPAETKASLNSTAEALKERFEPASQKTRYQAEFQTRRKKKTENWADLAEDLLFQADKAYPDLDNKSRETLALNAYLAQLDNPQIAFGVRQRTPANLDAAVSATLELESYLSPRATVANVTGAELKEEATTGQVGAVSPSISDPKLVTLVEKLIDRVEKLEASSQPHKRFSGRRDVSDREIVCWNCGKTGHVSRVCATPPKRRPRKTSNPLRDGSHAGG